MHDFALNRSKKLHNRWFVLECFPSMVFSEQILVGLLQINRPGFVVNKTVLFLLSQNLLEDCSSKTERGLLPE